jgi:hypothetical protein
MQLTKTNGSKAKFCHVCAIWTAIAFLHFHQRASFQDVTVVGAVVLYVLGQDIACMTIYTITYLHHIYYKPKNNCEGAIAVECTAGTNSLVRARAG